MNSKLRTWGLLCALLFGGVSTYAQLSNHSVVKTTEETYGLSIAAGTTFSIADNDDLTELDHFTVDQLFVYPEGVSEFAMSDQYTESFGSWAAGGTTAAPYYAIVSNPAVLRSSYTAKTDGINRLIFHAPAKNGGVIFNFTVSGMVEGGEKVVEFTLEEVANGGKSKLEIYANGLKCGEQELNSGASANVAVSLSNQETVKAASELEISLRRADYNEGDDCVYAVSDLYVAGDSYDIVAAYSNQDGSAALGSEATLYIAAQKGDYTITWQQLGTDGTTWSDLGTGSSYVVNPDSPGITYYRAVATDESGNLVTSNTLSVSRVLYCDEGSVSEAVFFEDFGTITDGETARACSDYVTGYTCNSDVSQNVKEGQYAIVANPYYAGCDGQCTSDQNHWFRNILDHTQGAESEGVYGGMLLANGETDGVVVYERTVDAEICANTYVNFSAWYANADHYREGVSYTDVNVELLVLDSERNPIEGASIIVDATIDEGWKKGEVSFYTGDNTSFIVQILNYGLSGAGSDVLIDDIMFSYCTPLADLTPTSEGTITISGDTATVKCNTDLTLTIDSEYVSRIFSEPYCLWLTAEGEDGTYNIDEENSGLSLYTKTLTVDNLTKNKVIIAADETSAREYFAETLAGCKFVAVTNEIVSRCTSIELSYTRSCNTINLVAQSDDETITWSVSTDGENWTTLSETGKQLQVEISEASYYKAADQYGEAQTDLINVQSIELTVSPTTLKIGGSVEVSAILSNAELPVTFDLYRNNVQLSSTEAENLKFEYSDSAAYTSAVYRVEAVGCVSQDVAIEVAWPTIFTPNGDGLNDTFASGLGIKISVFDRYGNEMAEKTDGWDGTKKNGSVCLPGVYFYVAELPDGSVKRGTIEIARFVTE